MFNKYVEASYIKEMKDKPGDPIYKMEMRVANADSCIYLNTACSHPGLDFLVLASEVRLPSHQNRTSNAKTHRPG
jgi:hypothetical protein